MKILVAGITTERHLSDFAYDVLDFATQRAADIFLFDNRGCDTLAQGYLASQNYRKVTVLTKNEFPAVNAAGWKSKRVASIISPVSEVDSAFVVWDGKDREIFDLIFAFLNAKKPVKIYMTTLGRMKNVESKRDLHLIGSIA